MGQINSRKYFSKFCYFTGLASLRWRAIGSYAVAVDYHYFTKSGIENQDLEVEYQVLERHLDFFSNYCEVGDARTQIAPLLSGEISDNYKPRVFISIDDADVSVLDALKTFEKHEIPFVLFVPTGLILKDHSRDQLLSIIFQKFYELSESLKLPNGEKATFGNIFNYVSQCEESKLEELLSEINKLSLDPKVITQRSLLSLQELVDLAKHPLVTLGSHSMTHPVFSELPLEWAEWEIKTSSKYITEAGGDSSLFAYPYGFKGSFNQETISRLKLSGVEAAFSTISSKIDKRSNPYSLGRVGMLNISDSTYLKGVVGGAFEYFDRILRRI